MRAIFSLSVCFNISLNDASDAILLERKDDMRRRGLASPDDGDALAFTFAYPVAKRDWAEERRFEEGLQRLKRWVR
jgi:hypothetical protein